MRPGRVSRRGLGVLLLPIALGLSVSAAANAPRLQVQQPLGDAHLAARSPDGRLVAAVHFRGGVTLWNATSGAVLRTWRLPGSSPRKICFLGTDKLFADIDGKFSVTDVRTGLEVPFGTTRLVAPRATCLPDGRVLLADTTLDGAGRTLLSLQALGADLAPIPLASAPMPEPGSLMLGRTIAVSPGPADWTALPVYDIAAARFEVHVHAQQDARRVDRVFSQSRAELPLTSDLAISRNGRHLLMAESVADTRGGFQHQVMHADRERRREAAVVGLPANRLVHIQALDESRFLIGYDEESVVWDADRGAITQRWPGRAVPLTGAAPEQVAESSARELRMGDWRRKERDLVLAGSAAQINGALVRPATLTVGTGDRLRSFRFPELDSATFDVSGTLREGVMLQGLSEDGRHSLWSIASEDVLAKCGATPEEIAILPADTDWIPFTTEHCFARRDAAGNERLTRMPKGESLVGVVFADGARVLFATTEIASLKRATAEAHAAFAAAERAKRVQSLLDTFRIGNEALDTHARNHFYLQEENGSVRRLRSASGEISGLAYLAARRQLAWLAGGRVRLLGLDGAAAVRQLSAPGRVEHFQVDSRHAYVVTEDPVPADAKGSVFAEALRPSRLSVLDLDTGRTLATRSPWKGMGEFSVQGESKRILARDSDGRLFVWDWGQREGHDPSMPRMGQFDEIRDRQASWVVVDRLGSDRRQQALWDIAKGDWWRPPADVRALCTEPLQVSPAGDSVLCRRDRTFVLYGLQEYAVIDLKSGVARFTFMGLSTARVGGMPRFLPTGELVSVGEREKDQRVLQLFDAKRGTRRDLVDSGATCGFCKFHVMRDAQGRLGVLREWVTPRFRRETEFVVFDGPELKRVAAVPLPLQPKEVIPTDAGLLVLGFNTRSASEKAGYELGELDIAAASWRSIGFREDDEWSPQGSFGGALQLVPGARTAILVGRLAGPDRKRGVVVHRVDLDTGDSSSLPLDEGFSDPHQNLSISPDGRHFVIRVERKQQHYAVMHAIDPLERLREVNLPGSSTRLRWSADGSFAAYSPGEGITEYEPATLRVVRTHRDSIAQGVEHIPAPDGQIFRSTQVEGKPALRRVGESAAFAYFPDGLPAIEEVVGAPAGGQHVITRHEDGGLALWDIGLRRWLARIFMSANGEWVVVDPEGRFDTSDIRGFNLARWSRVDRPYESLSPEVFMREYFEPRLLSRLMARENFRPVPPLDKLNLNQPRVAIRSISPSNSDPMKVNVEIDVASVDGLPVHDLRLFRDGQLVAWSPAQGGALNAAVDATPATLRFVDIALPSARSVEFAAYAFNGDGVRSEYSRRRLEQPAARPATRRAFVLSIGVNRTENPDFDLDFAGADARRLNEALVRRLTQTGLFASVSRTQVVSDDADRSGASKANIRTAVSALAKGRRDAPGPDDLVVISFSGHGVVDSTGSFHLVPHETGPKRENVSGLMPEDLKRLISGDELANWLRDIDAGEFVFIVDACHSAATVQSPDFKPGPMASRGLGQMAFDKGMRILAATQANDVAFEAKATQQGLLSYALVSEGLDAFRADFKPTDRRIQMDEWLAFAVNRVPDLTREVRTGTFRAAVGGPAPMRPRNAQPLPARIPLQRPSLFDFRQLRTDFVLQSRELAR